MSDADNISTNSSTVESPENRPRGKANLAVFASLLTFLKPYKGRVLGAAAALLFTAAITLSIGQGVKLLIDGGFVSESGDKLNSAIGFIMFLATSMAAGSFMRFYLVSWLGERVSADLRQAVFDHIINLHPSYFETNLSGEIMSRLTADTTILQSIIGSSLSLALRNAVMLVGALIILLITNLKLTLIVMASVPLVMLPMFWVGRKVRNLSRKSQDSIAGVGSYAGEAIQNIKTVQSFAQEELEKTAFNKEVEVAFVIARKRIVQRAVMIAIAIVVMFGGLSGMLWAGGHDVLSGAMTAGELGAFMFYALMVGLAVGTLSEVYGDLQRAAGATERLLELMSEPNEITAPVKPSELPSSLRPSASLSNVSFNYPSRPDIPALAEFTLDIEEGRSLALVGPSGAGKSTVFELLQRFYDPQQGAVSFGGVDIRELNPQQYRQQIAVVAQQPALFSTDVASNIRYGRPDASDEAVIAASKAAHAHEFISELPNGYGSFLGERGVRLSGGQRQRLAIARALLKNPRVLLLDEATSALDAESEYQIQLALQELMHGRTTVIIAHRLATVLHADKIAVLDQGRLVAQGTHASLVKSSPLYKRLADLQFRDEQREG